MPTSRTLQARAAAKGRNVLLRSALPNHLATSTHPTRARFGLGAIGLIVALWSQPGCGPSGHYTRSLLSGDEDGGSSGGVGYGDAGDSGAAATGGKLATGGTVGGGGGSGGSGTGGSQASGGMTPATGGAGSGGSGTGGRGGTGGAAPATGGAGTGGAASGGVGSGGSATGGAGTGGRGTGGATSGIISVDFAGTQTEMAATEMAGVKRAAHWNSAVGVSGSLPALLEKDGNTTSASLTWAAAGVWRVGWTDAAGDTRMMNGYLDPYLASAPAQVTISGLPTQVTASGYDVYVYTYGVITSGTHASNYTIGSATMGISQMGPSAAAFTSYTLAPDGGMGNYVLFRNVRGSSFTLTAAPGSASGTQTRAPVNGLQIVYPSGS